MLRATFKSLLSRKLRLILSGLAVVLGVMFVAGSFVLTNTLTNSFNSLFAGAYSHVAVEVSGPPSITGAESDNQAIPTNLPASLVPRIEAIPGVSGASGLVRADGAKVIGANGKVLTTTGAPQFGINWTGTSTLISIKDGHAPAADSEVVVDNGVFTDGDLHLGQQLGVSVYGVKHTFTLVGTFVYSGGRDSLGGEQTVAFTTPVAQQLMLGAPGVFNAINVTPAGGISDTTLRNDVAAGLGSGYVVQTGAQIAAKSTASLATQLSFVKDIFLGFAGVALFVGIFLILNTFSIIVAQRTKELALLRALGGSRRQVIGSVLIEALVIGVVASTVGLACGFGVGVLLAFVFSHVGNGSLQLTGVGLPASAIIAAYAVGITITMIAALLPALRAARIAPIAAMREAATPDRPLTRMTITGSVILAAGGALLGTGLAGAGGNTLALIVAGVLIAFIGVAVLTPAISRPVVAVLGATLSWSVPGMLGKRNSARNPRRTAITAAALMVGIALISGISIVLESTKTSATSLAVSTIKADLVIGGSSDSQTGFDPSILASTAAIPGVRGVMGLYQDAALIDGQKTFVAAVSDRQPLTDIYQLTTISGTLTAIGPHQAIVDAPTAAKLGLHVGDPVTIQLTNGGPQTVTLSGIYAKNLLTSGWVLNASQAVNFRIDQPDQAYIQLAPGTSVQPVKNQISQLLADSPEVNVSDFNQYLNQQTAGVNTVLNWIQILLALAILIAVLGVINTLALSVLERTREIGLLRAIGLSRARTMWMVTVESMVISVFGALLGIAVGTGLGVSVVRALHSKGIHQLSVPYTHMIVILVLAAIVGVIAAILPAIRAARTNVLGAISYE